MKYIFIFSFLTISFIGKAQKPIQLHEKYIKKLEKNSIDILDSTNLYVNDGQSRDLFYYALSPKNKIQGTLVLFPPTWQTAENVINHNIDLIEQAFENDLLLVVPSINYNLCLDETSLKFLNETFKNVLDKYEPPSDKIIFGGFSLGGMNALRYTELAYENESLTTLKPIAVYGIDPPLDFVRLYHSFENTLTKNFSIPAMHEAKDYLQKLNNQFGGTPEEFSEIYIQHSMFSKSEKDGGNAKFLTSIPVRIYCDPDIDWQLNERRMDYSDMNAVDQTAMINFLLLAGNNEAEFINALGKGYRMDGRRHPHSWSLVDPEECIAWMLKCMKISE